MAHRFTVIFEKEDEGGYHVFCPTLPGCHTQSETVEEGTKNIREAIELYIETLLEDGLPCVMWQTLHRFAVILSAAKNLEVLDTRRDSSSLRSSE